MPSCRVQPLLGLRRQTQVYQASTTDDLSPVTPLAQYSSPPAHCSYGTPQATRSTCKTITRMYINRISIVYAPFQCRSCPWIIQRLGQSTFSLQLSGSEFFSAQAQIPEVHAAPPTSRNGKITMMYHGSATKRTSVCNAARAKPQSQSLRQHAQDYSHSSLIEVAAL